MHCHPLFVDFLFTKFILENLFNLTFTFIFVKNFVNIKKKKLVYKAVILAIIEMHIKEVLTFIPASI